MFTQNEKLKYVLTSNSKLEPSDRTRIYAWKVKIFALANKISSLDSITPNMKLILEIGFKPKI